MNLVIEAHDLSKTYRLYPNPYDRLFEKLPWVKKPRYREVKALEGVSFHVEHGECMGLVGSNGAGKSTLLKVLSGTTFPTSGRYSVYGRVMSLLELGAGFHMSFTGRENVFMNAAMLGFSRKEAQKKYHEIVEFSELGDFIHAPVRTYSSGMAARLAFSVAVAAEPDLLIIDEILSVGDMNFRRKCVDKIWSYKKQGKSMFFCSHSLYDVRQICERAIWLRNGRMELLADSVTVTNEYATYETKLAEGGDPSPFADAPRHRLPSTCLASSKRNSSIRRPASGATSSRPAIRSRCGCTSRTAASASGSLWRSGPSGRTGRCASHTRRTSTASRSTSRRVT
jgi:ABC-type polysaccharide/polyol phosphate transport system ATPase subunit